MRQRPTQDSTSKVIDLGEDGVCFVFGDMDTETTPDQSTVGPEGRKLSELTPSEIRTLVTKAISGEKRLQFFPKRLSLTAKAIQLDATELLDRLTRHLCGDWGHIHSILKRHNDSLLAGGCDTTFYVTGYYRLSDTQIDIATNMRTLETSIETDDEEIPGGVLEY